MRPGSGTLRLILVLTAWLAHPAPTHASHTIFDFAVDRFTADGNAFGHLVEEFEGPWPPAFVHQFGTVYTRDGFLHLTNPGMHNLDLLRGTLLDISDVYTAAVVEEPLGSFVVTAAWAPTPLAYGNYIHTTLYTFRPATMSSGVVEAFSLSLSNFTREEDRTGGDDDATYQVVRAYLRSPDGLDGTWETFETEKAPVRPREITGEVVFRVGFDADRHAADASFSLDGGATFRAPFTSHPILEDTTHGIVLLGADPEAAPDPPPTTTTTTTTLPPCAGGATLTGQVTLGGQHGRHAWLRLRGRIVGEKRIFQAYDPSRDGLRLVLDGLLDASIPAAGAAGACGPLDGWHRKGHTRIYRNRSGVLPPACRADSDYALRNLRLTDDARDGTLRLVVDAAVSDLAPFVVPGGKVAATVVLGLKPASGCASGT